MEREVCVTLFGKRRRLCQVPSTQVTDVLAVVSAVRRRARMPQIGAERTAAVDAALATGGMGGVEGLRTLMKGWKEEHRAAIDVDAHYDARRVAAYTEWNAGPQGMLARRCLELAEMVPKFGPGSCADRLSGRAQVRLARESKRRAGGAAAAVKVEEVDEIHQHTPEDDRSSLPPPFQGCAIDVGCGSGLSSAALHSAGFRVVGVDLASEMLRTASISGTCEGVVRADMRQGLPVRAASVDLIFSIGALQFLLSSGGEDTARLFFSAARRALVQGGILAGQFCPSGDEKECAAFAEKLRAAAEAAQLGATVVVDQPHRTAGRRWFILCRSSPPALPPRRCLLYGGGVCCGLSVAGGGVSEGEVPAEKTHDDWLCAEHCRFASRALRCHLRGGPAVEQLTPAAAQAAQRLSLIEGLADGSPSSLRNNWKRVFEALHPQ
eukprot:Hpha_TRINITY_DN17194_c0_g1::TRINITY_DN17194_c0_g1_i1::g.146699::m.146699/K19306/BUD23; 18S rRNA (guanine1575-N7)-methyltransferase